MKFSPIPSDLFFLYFDFYTQTMSINSYDLDSFKQAISGSPYRLGLVYFVSMLHLMFEILSMKSDFSFWKNKSSFEGLKETYGRIGLLRSYGNLQSYWTTVKLRKLTVVLDYCEAMETYSRIGLLRS